MLILTRRIKETLCIGADVRIVVLGIRGRQVCLGIQAPGAVNIWRAELEQNGKRTTALRKGPGGVSVAVNARSESAGVRALPTQPRRHRLSLPDKPVAASRGSHA
jgi:carbon storage regulator